MATQNETVILSIQVDEGQTRERLKEITLLLASQKKGYQELQKEIRYNGTTTEDQARQLVDYKAKMDALNTEARVLGKTLQLNATQQRAAAGSYDQLAAASNIAKRNLNALEGTLQKNADGTYELTDAYRTAVVQVEAAAEALNQYQLGAGSGVLNVGKYANSIAGLEQKLKDLIATQRHIEPETEAFEETKKSIDETKISLGILSGQFDEFGNREPKNPQKQQLDAISDATAGAVSAFEIMNIVASENESINEAQAASLRAIAVAQNLRNIQIGIANAGEAASVVFTKASTLATDAKTKATVVATGVTRVFNTVIRANPLGLLLTALTAVVGAVLLFSEKFNLAAKIGQFFSDNFSGVVTWIEKTGQAMGLLDTATEKALKAMEKRKVAAEDDIKIMEALGNQEREIYEKRQKLMSQELALLNRQLQEKGKLNEEEKKQRQALLVDLNVLNIEERKRLADAAADAQKDREKLAKERLEQAKKDVEAALARRKELLDIQKGYIELNLDQVQKGSLQELKLREDLIKKQLEIENTGANISRERRLLNEARALTDITKLYNDYYAELSTLNTKLDPPSQEDMEKQMGVQEYISATEKKRRADQELAEAHRLSDEAMRDSVIATTETLMAQYGEQTTVYKAAFKLRQSMALAETAMALPGVLKENKLTGAKISALAPPISVPFGIAYTIAADLKAAADIGKLIADIGGIKLQGYYEGGYTEKGNPTEEATNLGRKPYTYHKSEYVVPARMLADPEIAETVEDLELYRTGRAHMARKMSGQEYLGASFMEGGYTAPQAAIMSAQAMAPAPVYPMMRRSMDEEAVAKHLAKEIAKIKIGVAVSEIKAGLKQADVKQGRTDI